MAGQPVNYDDDAPELTEAELAEFRPAREVLSAEQFAAASSVRRGRPKTANPKVPVTLRLDPAVYAALKSTGKGWHTRAGAVLAASVGIGQPEPPAKKRKAETTVRTSSKKVA